jgi:phosphoglycolate phosphatase
MTDVGRGAYRLAVFDFDGTLADSFPWFLGAVNQAAERYRFRRIEDGDVQMLRGLSARSIIAHLRVPAWKLPLVARYMRRLAAAEIGRITPFHGVLPLLHTLADRGVALAVVTSNSRENVARVLGPEIAARVAFWECGASVFGKARLFRRVMARAGVDPALALCIGDEVRDAEAARAAGVAFGAVTWGYTSADPLRAQNPAHLFHSVSDIAAAFEG